MESIILVLCLSLIGILAGHFLSIERSKRARFEKVADELRRVLDDSIIEISQSFPTTGRTLSAIIREQQRVIRNFRHFLCGRQLTKYNQACQKYYDCFEELNSSQGEISPEIPINLLEEIMRHTKYSMF